MSGMLSISGCNIARREPVAAIEPTYSYLRAPAAAVARPSEVAVAQAPAVRPTRSTPETVSVD
ncbi:MAG: hypothetical protein V3U29_08095 [Phycisphaeraceae bacterium]